MARPYRWLRRQHRIDGSSSRAGGGITRFRATTRPALPRTDGGGTSRLQRRAACALLYGMLMLSFPATARSQDDGGQSFTADALGLPRSAVQVDGSLAIVQATSARIIRIGEGEASASPGVTIERGATATINANQLTAALQVPGGAFDCKLPTVACPQTDLRYDRFTSGANVFVWDLLGAVERPEPGQTLRLAVLAYDPRFPLLNDNRPNSPFAGVNKIWVIDITATSETLRYFQVDNGQFREFRTDAIGGFNADLVFTLIASSAFAGVTHWNLHTYRLAGADEGGHTLVAPGEPLPSVTTTTTVQITSTPPEPCAPRPPVKLSVTPTGDGALSVTLATTGSAITELNISDGPNWVIEPPLPLDVPGDTAELTFRVRRTGPGSVSVPFTVTDGCGDWRTFVGGGAGAF